MKAVPVRDQTTKTAVKFFKGITCHFGMPHSIITDNGSNFDSKEFRKFCEKKVHFSSFNFHTSSLLVPNVSIGPKETLNFTNPIKCLGLLIFLRKKEKNKSD
jgi:hypothetical protein